MKKTSAFFVNKKKRLRDLVLQIDQAAIQSQRNSLNKIIQERKVKKKQLSSMRVPLEQGPFKAIGSRSSQFLHVEPEAVLEPFMPEKVKRSVDVPNRAYSSSPNMKAGQLAAVQIRKTDLDDKQVLNRKFMEYDRTIDAQSGSVKRERVEAKNLNSPFNKLKNSDMMKVDRRMKRTYFQKFLPDKFNFYDPSTNASTIRSSILRTKETDARLNRSRIQTQKAPQSMSLNSRSEIDENSNSLERSRFSKEPAQQIYAIKTIAQYRHRLQSYKLPKLQSLSPGHKNLNSIEY